MANISGTIYAASAFNYNIPATTAPSAYNIPFNLPDVFQGVLSSLNYTNGTGALQLDQAWWSLSTLVSTTLTIDLTSFTDPGGIAGNMARVREVLLYNLTATAGFDIALYKGASNGWAFLPASTNPLYARANAGWARISDPNSTGGGNGNVTGGASKTITLDSGAHTVKFAVAFLGTSVA